MAADQQAVVHLGLEGSNLLAEGRLGDVQHVGGLGEAADVDDLYEILQAPEIDGFVSVPRPRR
jgi:hypothetical protein